MPIVKLDSSSGKPIITTLYEVAETFVSEWDMPANYYEHNGKPFTFLIDTASNLNLINKEAVPLFKNPNLYEKADSFVNVVGSDNAINGGMKQQMSTGTFVYDLDFSVIDSPAIFNVLKEQAGKDVHGVLGLDFLQKNNCHIDLEHNVLEIK